MSHASFKPQSTELDSKIDVQPNIKTQENQQYQNQSSKKEESHHKTLTNQEKQRGSQQLYQQSTQNNTKLKCSPQKVQSKNPHQIPSLEVRLKKNKFLINIFNNFCNITFAQTKKQNFEQMGKIKSTLSLNKFMLFCKQFSIDQIIRQDIKNQSSNINSKTQSIHKEASLNQERISKRSPKTAMLQIPVKNIKNTQKYLTKIYRKNSQKLDQMTYQEFINVLIQIFNVFQKNISRSNNIEQIESKKRIEDKFLSEILAIKDVKHFQQKMLSVKMQLKGAISFNQNPLHKSTSFLNKKLVTHGGRSPDQMKKQLEIYQATKINKKQNWIEKQSQNVGAYSRSRVFYRPNPAKKYETNDVIRLARKQAGRTQTQSLFDFDKLKSESKQKQDQRLSFSKIFEDKTNKFSEKLQKIRQKYQIKDKQVRQKGKIQKPNNKERERQQDDEILERYFENERKTYGDQKYSMSIHF